MKLSMKLSTTIEGDYTGIYAEVQDPADWGGDGQYAYISINSEMSFEVDLGWPGIVRRDRDYYSARRSRLR